MTREHNHEPDTRRMVASVAVVAVGYALFYVEANPNDHTLGLTEPWEMLVMRLFVGAFAGLVGLVVALQWAVWVFRIQSQ